MGGSIEILHLKVNRDWNKWIFETKILRLYWDTNKLNIGTKSPQSVCLKIILVDLIFDRFWSSLVNI